MKIAYLVRLNTGSAETAWTTVQARAKIERKHMIVWQKVVSWIVNGNICQ